MGSPSMGLSKQMSKLLLLLSIFGFLLSTAVAQRVIVSSAIKHDVSPAVRDLPVIARSEHENRAHLVKHWPHKPVVSAVDPVVQSSATPAMVTSNVTVFPGVGNGVARCVSGIMTESGDSTPARRNSSSRFAACSIKLIDRSSRNASNYRGNYNNGRIAHH